MSRKKENGVVRLCDGGEPTVFNGVKRLEEALEKGGYKIADLPFLLKTLTCACPQHSNGRNQDVIVNSYCLVLDEAKCLQPHLPVCVPPDALVLNGVSDGLLCSHLLKTYASSVIRRMRPAEIAALRRRKRAERRKRQRMPLKSKKAANRKVRPQPGQRRAL